MGSFNTTCFVSQQTIVPGAEALIFPIRKQASDSPVSIVLGDKETSQYGHTHSTCYATAFWRYAGPVIKGRYDDYGKFDLLETPSNTSNLLAFFKYLYNNSFETKEGENTCHDLGVDFRILYNPKVKEYGFGELFEIWDKVWEVAQEQRFFVRNYDYEDDPRSLGFAVMHHKAAEYLINAVNDMESWDNASYEQRGYFKRYMQNRLSRVMSIMDKPGRESAEIYEFFGIQASSLNGFGVGDQARISSHYDHFDPVVSAVENYCGSEQFNGELSEEFMDSLFEIFKDDIDHRYIHTGLDMFNLKLSPMVYASQDYSNVIGKSYAKMIASVSELVTHEIKIWNGEDDDEEISMSNN